MIKVKLMTKFLRGNFVCLFFIVLPRSKRKKYGLEQKLPLHQVVKSSPAALAC